MYVLAYNNNYYKGQTNTMMSSELMEGSENLHNTRSSSHFRAFTWLPQYTYFSKGIVRLYMLHLERMLHILTTLSIMAVDFSNHAIIIQTPWGSRNFNIP